ncbi:MAG: T9SS type A sorting domain-containing protein [Bacteroidia bacterium]
MIRLILLIILMLPIIKTQAAYNLRNVGMFNTTSIMVDVFTIDDKIYALLDYRPNNLISGFKLYKAKLNYEIEDSLVYESNKLQTFITNAVVNDDKTISIAITKHNGLELKPSSFVLMNIDKQLKILSEKNIDYSNLNIDYFQFANLVKLKNNILVLNLVLDKDFGNEYRTYNVYIKCSQKEGIIKYLEDTIEMVDFNGMYNSFATFNMISFNDTILFLKVPSIYINKYISNALVLKRISSNLDIISSSYKYTPIMYFNSFHSYFSINNKIYFYGVFRNIKESNSRRSNPNIVEILPNDSFLIRTNIDNPLSESNSRDYSSNKAIVIKGKDNLFGITTHMFGNDTNFFSITNFKKDFTVVWNRFYKLPAKAVFINGIISSGNELIVYGWQRDYFELTYRPLFLTITEDGWLTGINESIVKHEIELNLYPNPAKQNVTIQTNASVQSVHITDMQGKVIKTVGSNIDLNEIDIADLPPGMYIVQLQTPNGILTKKLVVE